MTRAATPRTRRAPGGRPVQVGAPAYGWAPLASRRGFWEPVEVRAQNADGTFRTEIPSTGRTVDVAADALRPAPPNAFSRGALLLRYDAAVEAFHRALYAVERASNARHPELADAALGRWAELPHLRVEGEFAARIATTPGAPLPTDAENQALQTWFQAQLDAMEAHLQMRRDFADAIDRDGLAAIERYKQSLQTTKAPPPRALANPPRGLMNRRPSRRPPGRFPRRVPPVHANPPRTPTLVDRGYGIGRHAYNDLRIDRGAVREIIVSDVFGENTYRYNLDTQAVEPLGRAGKTRRKPWSWAEVREVVTRDLVRHGLRFGEPYGTVDESTLYGLYHGRRPSYIPETQWKVRKGFATLSNPPSAAPRGQRVVSFVNPSPMVTEAEARARIARLDQREAVLQGAASFGDPLRIVHAKSDVDWNDEFSGNLLSGSGIRWNRERRQDLRRKVENRIHHERFLARKALQQARQGSSFPPGTSLDWYIVAERGDGMGFFAGPYDTQDEANALVHVTAKRAEEKFGSRSLLGVTWGITGLPAGTPQATHLPLHDPAPAPAKPKRKSSKKRAA